MKDKETDFSVTKRTSDIPQEYFPQIIKRLKRIEELVWNPIKYVSESNSLIYREAFTWKKINDSLVLDIFNKIKREEYLIGRYKVAVNYFFNDAKFDGSGFFITKYIFFKKYFTESELDGLLVKYDKMKGRVTKLT